ncbi:uncharacterized protein LOC119657153 [Hermetia illucens]|uniref:uncharacterized protein LOC119657153 n=1 Tax=Hermetia illucens TaxID=343691 RepID=UPI0018CC547B|nr:uncharacterized protein LOC119657153 [Hermetia illucens]
MKVARNFCANICSILLIASSTFAARIPPSEQHTWLGFGERELGDQLLILDERTTNSTVPISQSIIFQYEDLSFTFANLTVYDGFDKVIHTYDNFLSKTEVQFINSTRAEAQIAIYGFSIMPMKKQPGTADSKPKKIVFSNNKRRV